MSTTDERYCVLKSFQTDRCLYIYDDWRTGEVTVIIEKDLKIDGEWERVEVARTVTPYAARSAEKGRDILAEQSLAAILHEDKNPVDVDAHTIDCTDECECMGGKDSDCTVCDGHRFAYDPDRSGHILAWDQCIYCAKDREDHG
jgi:hypothetical protein